MLDFEGFGRIWRVKVFLSSFNFFHFSHQPKLTLFALWIWLLKIIQGPCWKRRQNGWIVIVVEAGGGEWLPSRHTVASSCASTHLLSSYLAEKSTVIACHITGWTQLTVSPKSVSYHSSPNPYTYFQPHQQIMQWFFWCRGPYFDPSNTNHTKNKKKHRLGCF